MISQTIYKRDNNGNIRTWQYQVDETNGAWRSRSGIKDGAIVESGWTTCVPKSRPTAAEQAHFEAKAELGKKLDKDYALTEAGVDEARDFGPKVMLAHKYEGVIPAAGAFSQPKLDGIRCKVNRHGMWTRTGKPILGAPHIFAILAPAFLNKPELEFDGELYNHDLHDDFNKIVSMVRKAKPTDADIEEASKLVQYHVYDIVRSDLDFGQRDQILELFVMSLGAPEIVKVPTSPVANAEQAEVAFGNYLADFYEGQIIRINGPYENKRSKLLLKNKEFVTEEFELVEIEAGNGNWAGVAKGVVFRLKDGRTCGAGVRGTQPQMKELLERAPSLVGKPVTIRYLGLTPAGKPRCGVAIDFDRTDALAEAA